jgi:hypothetical protein
MDYKEKWKKFCEKQANGFDAFSKLQRHGIAGVFEIEGASFISSQVIAPLQEQYQKEKDEAYQKGIKDGQAKMNNSGRLLYQDGYKSALTELLESLPKEMSDKARGGDSPERKSAQLYWNFCLAEVKALITKMLKEYES